MSKPDHEVIIELQVFLTNQQYSLVVKRFAAQKGGVKYGQAEALFDAVLGQGARLPSARRFAARALSDEKGIHLSKDEAAMLDRMEKDWFKWECHELCVSGLAHAGFRYGHAC